ncbi:MAG: hypothetical protein NZ516_09850 [Raineya sp.]|nr:hypothetical protein [Raineya sp.]
MKAFADYIPATTSGSIFTNYTEVEDTLNEFDAITGEFTASQAGLYMVAGSARLVFNPDGMGLIIIQKYTTT